jgi:predicted RecA/RadA family phage recombinase
MAKNFNSTGKVVTVTTPAGGVSSGDPVMIGTALFGVATHSASAGAELELATEGDFTLPADNTITMSAGDRLFWDSTNGWVDKTSAAQVNVATCLEDKAQAGTTVRCKLGATTPAGT